MLTPRSSMISASCSAPPGCARSAVTTRVATPLMRAKSDARVSSFSRERPVSTRLQPRCASCRANSSPKPEDAPVTSAKVPEKTSLSISSSGRALAPKTQIVVCQHDRHHRFANGHEARQEAWVVATFGADRRVLTVARDRLLLTRQAARRLDRRAHDDRHARRDPSEHAAVTVGAGLDAAHTGAGFGREELVVVLAATLRRARKTRPIFDAHHRRQAK